jgi:NitT/TauT family transport system ATP-binding protein
MKDVMELEIKDLQKVFTGSQNGALPALKGIDLSVSSGEFVSIVGPSGCGKSTLLEIIAGLQDRTSGEMSIDGIPIEKSTSNRAIVFQHYGLFPWLTVQKNVEYGLKIRGIAKRRRHEVGRKYIDMVRLNAFEKYYPYELSGGMQQRVALARALANDPDMLLLDEPFAALDAQTKESCQQELLTLWSNMSITVVFVTHDVSEAIFLADRVVVMSSAPGTVREIMRVDLPRPRDFSIRMGARFREMEHHLRQSISENQRHLCIARGDAQAVPMGKAQCQEF